jgi:hypothetical protein
MDSNHRFRVKGELMKFARLPAGGSRIRTIGPAKGAIGAVAAYLSHPVVRDEPIDAMGRAARNGNFVAASNRWSASDAPAERLEQVPRRPGPE